MRPLSEAYLDGQGRRELGEIVSHIWHDDPAAAKCIRNRVEKTTMYLKSQHFIGRPGAVSGTRETIPHPSYRLVYQVTGETVFILSIIHTSRQWPLIEDQGDA